MPCKSARRRCGLRPPQITRETAAEDAIRASSLDWTIIRPTMIYGTPGDRNMWRLLRFLRATPMVPLPDGGTNLQQPVHVEDLAAAIVTAASTSAAIGQAYDVGGPEAITFRRVVEDAAAAVGRHPKLVPISSLPVLSLLRFVERSGRARHG